MPASWEKALANAFIVIDDACKEGIDLTGMTLGGGTGLMLQINHRNSYDIDFFLPDPQLLGYLTAAAEGMAAWHPKVSYRGDGSRFLKISFASGGEVDFIAAPPVTNHTPVERRLQGRTLHLEAVPEIIASKVHYRGNYLQARDIFDIAAASEAGYREEIRRVLATIPDDAATALNRVGEQQGRDLGIYMNRMDIRPGFEHLLSEGPAIAKDLLTVEPAPKFKRRTEPEPNCDPDFPDPGP